MAQIDPVEGPLAGGIHAKLTGLHFDDGSHNLSVSFGGAAATVTALDDSSADVTIPPGATAGPVDISVSNANGTATLPGGFTYTCSVNYSLVAGQCVDFATDSDNCGTPGNVCSATTACLGGTCTTPTPMPTARTARATTLGPDGKIYVIGGWGGGNCTPLDTVEVYDPRTNAWKSVASIPKTFAGGTTSNGPSGAVTTRDGTIRAIGADGVHYAYDLSSNTWIERATLPTSQYLAGVTLGSDGRVLVLGAFAPDGRSGEKVARAYTPATDAWTTLPAPPHPHTWMGAATASNGLTYAFGGVSETAVDAKSVDAFNPVAGTWSSVMPMPEDLQASTATAGPGAHLIYLVGAAKNPGTDRRPRFYIYDAAQDAWTKGPDLTKAHFAYGLGYYVGLVVGVDGRTFAVGGGLCSLGATPSSVQTRAIEVYDPKRNVWVASSP